MAKLTNFIAFQLVWFACVIGAAHQWQWAGFALATAFVALTLRASITPKADLVLVVAAVVGGSLLDSLWAVTGVMSYAATPWGNVSPPWILGLWAAFAITINHSLAWLRFRYGWMALLAAIASPFSYYAGARLGAVQWLKPEWLLLVIPLSWALFLYGLCRLNHKLLGGQHAPALD